MSSLITINVTNNSSETRDFFFFQQPASYAGNPDVHANSLQSTPIVPQAQGGSSYTFYVDLDYHAGVQGAHGAAVAGRPSGYAPAIQPGGRDGGNLRIVAPGFDASAHGINAGCAIRTPGGGAVLSNFVQVGPSEILDCRPDSRFYVAIGHHPMGTVLDLRQAGANAALCDARQGHDTFDVRFGADGAWTVTASHAGARRRADAHVRTLLNATIRNNVGTKLVCQGRAVTKGIPVIIEDLSAPRSLLVHSEYQISLDNGPFRGFILTELSDAGQAVFD